MKVEKFNAKQFANKLIAEHLEKLEIAESPKLKAAHKISQTDSVLLHAYMTMTKAELIQRFTRVKSKKLVGEKETEATK